MDFSQIMNILNNFTSSSNETPPSQNNSNLTNQNLQQNIPNNVLQNNLNNNYTSQDTLNSNYSPQNNQNYFQPQNQNDFMQNNNSDMQYINNNYPQNGYTSIYPEPLNLNKNGKIINNSNLNLNQANTVQNTSFNNANSYKKYVNMPTYSPQNQNFNFVDKIKSILTPEFISILKQVLPLLQNINNGNGGNGINNLLSGLLGNKKNVAGTNSNKNDIIISDDVNEYIKIDNN